MELKTWLRLEWDRVLGFALVAAGAIVLFAGYNGVGNSAYVAEQIAYLVSGGLGGIFLLAVGATFLIRSDLHDHWRQLDRIESAIRGERVPDPASTNGTTAVVEPIDPTLEVVAPTSARRRRTAALTASTAKRGQAASPR
jgi:hypothetical protein